MSESKEEWLQRIADLHGLDAEDIEEIAELCLEDTAENVALLTNIDPAADMSTPLRAAHSIKGSAANIGLNSLSDAAQTIESQLGQNNLVDLEHNVSILNEAFGDFKKLVNS
jgi:HPt (histidine-containing phosphotransfer) domain-containing protein